jgi:hypothetical protein
MWQGGRIDFSPVESHAPRKRHTRATPLVNGALFGNFFQRRHATAVAFDMAAQIVHVPNQVFLVDGDFVDCAANIVQEFDVSFGDRDKYLVCRPYPGPVQGKTTDTEEKDWQTKSLKDLQSSLCVHSRTPSVAR